MARIATVAVAALAALLGDGIYGATFSLRGADSQADASTAATIDDS
jgi:hypothetical protein